MPHSHSHAPHGHGHDHGPLNINRAFAYGVALNLVFVAVEATYGLASGSLSLLADAGHNFSDVLGLLLAWGAVFLATKQATPRRTYGWRRSSILAALFNALLLLVALGGIAGEAVRRFAQPAPVATGTVIIVATLGIVINTATALLFAAGRQNDLNLRGAFLHMAADAGVSAGVVVAALLIRFTGWLWLDPLVSLLIAGVILLGTWGLLRESLDLALDAVPPGIDAAEVGAFLRAVDGVRDVHDLHIWAISTTETALTAHLRVENLAPDFLWPDDFLRRVAGELHDRFGIEHSTLQIETQNCDQVSGCGQTAGQASCESAPDAPNSLS